MQYQNVIQRIPLVGVVKLLPLVCVVALGVAWGQAYGAESGLMGAVLLVTAISVATILFAEKLKFEILSSVLVWALILAAILLSWPLRTVWYFDPITTGASPPVTSAEQASEISQDSQMIEADKPLTLSDLFGPDEAQKD